MTIGSTQLALTPHLLMEVYFGHAGKHAAKLASGQGLTAHLYDVALFGGLVATITVMVFVSHLARKALNQAVAKTEAEGLEPDTH